MKFPSLFTFTVFVSQFKLHYELNDIIFYHIVVKHFKNRFPQFLFFGGFTHFHYWLYRYFLFFFFDDNTVPKNLSPYSRDVKKQKKHTVHYFDTAYCFTVQRLGQSGKLKKINLSLLKGESPEKNVWSCKRHWRVKHVTERETSIVVS